MKRGVYGYHFYEDYGWLARVIWEVQLVEGGFVSSSLLVAVVVLEVLYLETATH